MSKFSEFSINMLDRINAVLNITRNIITSLSGSKSKWTHSNTTSPCTEHWMSILITSQSACNKKKKNIFQKLTRKTKINTKKLRKGGLLPDDNVEASSFSWTWRTASAWTCHLCYEGSYQKCE